jgi:hypothetical protein
MMRENRRHPESEQDRRQQTREEHRIRLALAAAEDRSKRDDGLSQRTHGPDAQNRVMPLSSRATEATGGRGLPMRNRSAAYASVIGVVVALLAAGLAIPYLFGHPERTAAAGRLRTGPVGASLGGPTATQGPDAAAAAAQAAAAAGAGGGGFGRATAGAAAGAAASRAGGPTGPLAPGITDKEVHVGIPIFNVGIRLPVEGLDPVEQKAQWNSYIDAVNKGGGVQGRQLVPVFGDYNPLNPDSFRAMCLALTENTQVFAVLGYGIFDNQAPCFAQEHGVPVVNAIGVSDATMAASSRRILTVDIGKDRALRNHALMLDKLGLLKGKTVGVVTSTDRNDAAQVEGTLLPLLRQLGVKVGHESNLSSDQSTALAQIPVETRAMQASGVNLIFLDLNLLYGAYFVQNADQQGYHPQYTTSDFEQLVEDGETMAYTQGFDGAIGVTALRTGDQRVGQPEPPFDAHCRDIYQSASGAKYARGDIQYDTTEGICSVVDITAKALTIAGRFPTRDSFIAAGETLKNFDLAYSAPGAFQPAKHDAPQFIRVAQWHYDCKCWIPSGAFEPALA